MTEEGVFFESWDRPGLLLGVLRLDRGPSWERAIVLFSLAYMVWRGFRSLLLCAAGSRGSSPRLPAASGSSSAEGVSGSSSFQASSSSSPSRSPEWDGAEFKMVLLVRMDFGMGKGKIAAQCGHAVLGAYKRASFRQDPFLEAWEWTGSKKVAVNLL